MTNDKKLSVIYKGVKANTSTIKTSDMQLIGSRHEYSVDLPACVFIDIARSEGIPREEIKDYLRMDDKTYNEMVNYHEVFIAHWQYKQKRKLIENYLKYHG
jgi:hypothetical protein